MITSTKLLGYGSPGAGSSLAKSRLAQALKGLMVFAAIHGIIGCSGKVGENPSSDASLERDTVTVGTDAGIAARDTGTVSRDAVGRDVMATDTGTVVEDAGAISEDTGAVATDAGPDGGDAGAVRCLTRMTDYDISYFRASRNGVENGNNLREMLGAPRIDDRGTGIVIPPGTEIDLGSRPIIVHGDNKVVSNDYTTAVGSVIRYSGQGPAITVASDANCFVMRTTTIVTPGPDAYSFDVTGQLFSSEYVMGNMLVIRAPIDPRTGRGINSSAFGTIVVSGPDVTASINGSQVSHVVVVNGALAQLGLSGPNQTSILPGNDPLRFTIEGVSIPAEANFAHIYVGSNSRMRAFDVKYDVSFCDGAPPHYPYLIYNDNGAEVRPLFAGADYPRSFSDSRGRFRDHCPGDPYSWLLRRSGPDGLGGYATDLLGPVVEGPLYFGLSSSGLFHSPQPLVTP